MTKHKSKCVKKIQMRKLLLLLSIIVFFSLAMVNAQAIITFDEKEHNFEQIYIEDGYVSCDFVFRNTGKSPLLIKSIAPSDRCVSSYWIRSVILRERMGLVTVNFVPEKLGEFMYTLRVNTYGTSNSYEVLTIKGEVIDKRTPRRKKIIAAPPITIVTPVIELNDTSEKEKNQSDTQPVVEKQEENDLGELEDTSASIMELLASEISNTVEIKEILKEETIEVSKEEEKEVVKEIPKEEKKNEKEPAPMEKKKDLPPKTEFPYSDKGFLLTSKEFNFFGMNKGMKQTRVIKIKNVSGKTKEIYFAPLLDYITYEAIPRKLKNGEEGEISVTLDSEKCPLWDRFTGEFYLITEVNSTNKNSPTLKFVAEIVEDLSQLTATERANAPKLKIDTTQVRLGVIEKDSKHDIHFTFKNNGKNPLRVHKIINKNKEISIVSYPASVESSQTGILLMQLDTKHFMSSTYKKKFYMQTNDPNNQLTELEINWEIE
jgi:hypothetical protein